MRRGLIDRITNRDVVAEQKIHIDLLMREVKERNELVTVQAEAIDGFKEQVAKLSEEISELWESVNSSARKKREKDEQKSDESG